MGLRKLTTNGQRASECCSDDVLLRWYDDGILNEMHIIYITYILTVAVMTIYIYLLYIKIL
jgi:hypothetical protein